MNHRRPKEAQIMSDWIKTIRDLPLSSYLLCGLIVVGTFLLRFVLIRVSRRLSGGKRESAVFSRYAVLDRTIRRLVIPGLYLGASAALVSLLHLDALAQKLVRGTFVILGTYFSVRLVNSLIGLFLQRYLEQRERPERQKRVKPILSFLKALVWVIGALFMLDNMGVQISSIMAGLGIGGIAVALAAQSILGDLFSYFIIFFDRPFELGDFIVFDSYMGTVEEIGVKTTKIRALSGEQIVVSNSALTGARIRNYKRMESRRVEFSLAVTYGTEPEKLMEIPGIIKRAVEAQSATRFDRAHLRELGESGLSYECVYYVESPDYNLHMDIHHAINIRLIKDLGERGIEFAFPTRTLYVAGQPSPS
jgi:small-conductance mechanosensitive channel